MCLVGTDRLHTDREVHISGPMGLRISVSSKAQVYNKIDMLSISHLGSMTHGYSAVEEDSDSLTLNFQYLQLIQFVQPISLYGCAAVLTLKRAQCNADNSKKEHR